MAIRRSAPLPFSPVGLYDSLDGTNVPEGACMSLANLCFDVFTPNTLAPRPAAVEQTNHFAGFTTPANASVIFQIGTRIYGMVASGLHAGFDQPFCYDLSTGAFVTIGGVTGSNVPTTQPAGDWTPPTMTQVSTYILVTHPGFNGSGNGFFGYFNVANPAAVTWASGNTATNPLPAVPTAVCQYYNRAYFACSLTAGGAVNAAYLTDSLAPLTITNASQFLVVGDSSPIQAFSSQSFDASTGGVIQSLIILKKNICYQVSGDFSATAANNTLSLTPLQGLVGTSAPRSVCFTPDGTIFMANSGLWIVTITGQLQQLNQNVVAPFKYATTITRTAAAYNNNVYRISVYNGAVSGSPHQEYWYHFDKNEFTGPHSFPFADVVQYGGTFIGVVDGLVGLWQADCQQSSTSVFIENGTALQWVYQTATYPDIGMSVSAIIEGVIDIAFGGLNSTVNVNAVDGNNSVIATATIVSVATVALWGSVIWGAFRWAAAAVGFKRYSMYFNQPVVAEKYAIQVQGASSLGLKLGNIWLRVQSLGYSNV